jgi:hypothetical protein
MTLPASTSGRWLLGGVLGDGRSGVVSARGVGVLLTQRGAGSMKSYALLGILIGSPLRW